MINISKAAFTADVQAGLKREEIIAKYSTAETKLTNAELTRILKATGLTIRKFAYPKFMLVDDATPLPMDPTVAIEVKQIAEQGNPVVDYTATEVISETSEVAN